MNEELKAFVEEHKGILSDSWTLDQKASELAMWALETFADLPELDMSDGRDMGHEGGVSQKEFDRAVEEAYTFYKGEIARILE